MMNQTRKPPMTPPPILPRERRRRKGEGKPHRLLLHQKIITIMQIGKKCLLKICIYCVGVFFGLLFSILSFLLILFDSFI